MNAWVELGIALGITLAGPAGLAVGILTAIAGGDARHWYGRLGWWALTGILWTIGIVAYIIAFGGH